MKKLYAYICLLFFATTMFVSIAFGQASNRCRKDKDKCIFSAYKPLVISHFLKSVVGNKGKSLQLEQCLAFSYLQRFSNREEAVRVYFTV